MGVDDEKELEPQQQQQQSKNDIAIEDDEWSNHDDDLKFDPEDEYIPEDEEEKEARRQTLHDTITGAHTTEPDDLFDIDSIIQNFSICLGFLLHKKSPLWNKQKHHSTKNLVKNHKNKKKAYTFSERCSIFK